MAKRRTDSKRHVVNLRRMYVDCRDGQLHLRTAYPSSGGFGELTAVLCLHGDGETGRVFGPLLAELGGDRSVYAPDLPGCGESDAPARRRDATDMAATIGDFLDHMRLRQVDVLGHRQGGAIAAELALARPDQVRRVVLVAAEGAGAVGGSGIAARWAGMSQPVLMLEAAGRRRPRDTWPSAAKCLQLPPGLVDTLAPCSGRLGNELRRFLD